MWSVRRQECGEDDLSLLTKRHTLPTPPGPGGRVSWVIGRQEPHMKTNRRALLVHGNAALLAASPLGAALASLGSSPIEAKALDLLTRIHHARHLSRPRNNAYCILECGALYLQALAPSEHNTIWLEAVSPRFAPEAWRSLGRAKAERLAQLGFVPPGPRSPNSWQVIDIRDERDLRGAARLVTRVFEQAFGVTDPSSVQTILRIPTAAAPARAVIRCKSQTASAEKTRACAHEGGARGRVAKSTVNSAAPFDLN